MTCSSSTTFTPERRQVRRWLLPLAAALALAMPGLFAVQGLAAAPAPAADLIAKARAALGRSDGIAAEIHLKQALAKGAPRAAVNALMGEALLDQDDPAAARLWLGSGQFTRETAVRGLRTLAQLERVEGNLPAAGRAFDRALAIAPDDALMWVEIGALRYAGGEHLLAIEAADRALQLDPANVRALTFRGQLVRDRFGLLAALPWFENALKQAPGNIEALGEYAATLGDLGRASEMLGVTRRMLDLDGNNARAFYLQAVLAARAGNIGLARAMLARGGKPLEDLPGAMLLSGVLELGSGNHAAAAEVLTRLTAVQPANARAQALLARALHLGGEHAQVVARFAVMAQRPDTSPYLLTVLARSHEALGQRELAAPLLDRAARDYSRPIAPVALGSEMGAMLAAGNGAAALSLASQRVAATPGNGDLQAQAGDAALATGQAAKALDHYRIASRVRCNDSLLLRMSVALEVSRQGSEAADLVETYLTQTPSSHTAAWLAAGIARRRQDWPRAVMLFDFLRQDGGTGDVRLLLDLAHAQLKAGDSGAAVASAHEAWQLQRGSGYVADIYGQALAATGRQPARARALRAKARAMGTRFESLPPVRYAFAPPV